MFTPSVNPKELTINLRTVTHLNPLDQELLSDTQEKLVGTLLTFWYPCWC